MTSTPVCAGSVTKSRSTIAGPRGSIGSWRSATTGPLAVERPAERIDHAAKQAGPDRRAQHVAGAARGVARLDLFGRVDQDAIDDVARRANGRSRTRLCRNAGFRRAAG